MNGMITVFGYGPVGRATTELLATQGRYVRVAQRQAPRALPKGASFAACDALDADAVLSAARGSATVVVAIGLPYVGKVWREAWPAAMRNFVSACEQTGARMIFIDNLYMYGPQTAPLQESMRLTSYGQKPAARAEATRIWSAAAAAGRLRATALRAPDFYGPGVALAHLGDTSVGALARGKRAVLFGSPDTPHDFAYVPDIARAVATLVDAPDDAYARAWHVPCAPTQTPRKLLAIAAETLKVPLRVSGLPTWALGAMGLVAPPLREMAEMSFQWDRPYRVDARQFGERFWSDATPFEVGMRATALSFRDAR